MKIAILDTEHSAKVQHALFELGYSWAGDQTTRFFMDDYIHADPKNLKLSFGFSKAVFKDSKQPEYVLDESNALVNKGNEMDKFRQNEWSYRKCKYVAVGQMPWKQVILNGFLVALTFAIVGGLGAILAWRG